MTNLFLFGPETILLGLIVAQLGVLLGPRGAAERWSGALTALGAVAAGAAAWATLNAPAAGAFGGTYRIDALSQGYKMLFAAALLVTAIVSRRGARPRLPDGGQVPDGGQAPLPADRAGETHLFLATGTLGMMMMPCAADLLTLYISLELSSYSLYLLASLRRDRRDAEAGVKYLLFGAATSGFMLWGMSLLAGLAGTTSLVGIADASGALAGQPVFLLALVLVSFAFLFKLSAFPLHFWAPDAYQIASTPAVLFIATASKAAAVAVLSRFFIWTGPIQPALVSILGAVAFLSMTLGNAAALVQRSVKRLLAYSSVAQAGYILVGLLSGSLEGYSSAFFYAVAYAVMNAGALLVVLAVSPSARTDDPELRHFDGLAERSPFLALILLLSLLSLAGIPPLAGFTGKWVLFSAAMDKGHWFLVLWGVLNSVVSLYYYLTLVKHVYLEKAADPSPLVLSPSLKALGLAVFVLLVGLGVFPSPLIEFARSAVTTALIR